MAKSRAASLPTDRLSAVKFLVTEIAHLGNLVWHECRAAKFYAANFPAAHGKLTCGKTSRGRNFLLEKYHEVNIWRIKVLI